MKIRNVYTILMLIGSLFVLTGCPSAGVYRTAHTLGQGESDVGLTFSGFKVKTVASSSTNSETQEVNSPVIPNIIPELSYHIGLGNNMEVGGRIALGSMLFELDFKYKFFESLDKRTHMAFAPALGYRSFVLIEGYNVNLPVILTYDLTDNFSFNAFLYSSYINFKSALDDGDDGDVSDSGGFFANSVTVGGGVGFKYSGETFYFMPSVDVARTVMSFGDYAEDDEFSVTYVVFSITLGWLGGKEMKKLKRMDHKLDRIESKIDGRGGAEVVPPPPGNF